MRGASEMRDSKTAILDMLEVQRKSGKFPSKTARQPVTKWEAKPFYSSSKKIMFGSTQKQGKIVTITGLKAETMETQDAEGQYPTPQFALISDISNPMGNFVCGYFNGCKKNIYKSDKYGDSLQAEISLIDAKTGESAILRANITGVMRKILNKLASQDKLGFIKIELFNVPQFAKEWEVQDKTKRSAACAVYNNWEKIKETALDFEKELALWSIIQTKNKKGKLETDYHDVTDIDNDKWHDIKLLKMLSNTPIDMDCRIITDDVEVENDVMFGDDTPIVDGIKAKQQEDDSDLPF